MLTLPGRTLRVEEFGKNFGFDSGRSFLAPRLNQLRVGVLAPWLNRFEVAKLVEPTCER